METHEEEVSLPAELLKLFKEDYEIAKAAEMKRLVEKQARRDARKQIEDMYRKEQN